MAKVHNVEFSKIDLITELEHKSEKKGFFERNDIWDISFSSDGKYLAVGFCKYEVQIWNF